MGKEMHEMTDRGTGNTTGKTALECIREGTRKVDGWTRETTSELMKYNGLKEEKKYGRKNDKK